MAVTSAQVQELYVGLLGRAADKAGLDYWLGQLNAEGSTLTLENLRANFVNEQPEYAATYGSLARADLVTAIYQNLFERTPSADEVNYWANGTVSADQMVVAFLNGASAADKQVVGNKVFVAETYSNTVGANYTAAGATAAVANVDGTAASVSAATAAIANGSLAGSVPAQGLINALASAQAAVPAFETANKAAVDALVAKLAPIDTASDATDLLNANSAFSAKLAAAKTDADEARTAAGKGEADTSVLITRAATAATELDAARAALTPAEKANASKYEAAVTAEAAAKAAAATATDKAAVVAGLGADATATAGLAALGTPDDPATPAADGVPLTATQVYSNYVNGTAAARTAIDTAFKDSKYYSTFKATVAKDAAYADAIKATTAAKDLLDTDTAVNASVDVNGVTVTLANDTTAGSAAANTFVTKAVAKAEADATVKAAQAADATKATVDALVKQYADVNKAIGTAGDAITAFNAANTTVKAVAIAAGAADSAVKETFYFAAKPTGIAADDVAISNFGAGDSIVLGSNVTYNSGALSAGNNNAAEFFLVKTDAGVQVVIENTVYGSAGVTPVAATGVASAADNLTVITLTGVTVDHVSVANGVISYV